MIRESADDVAEQVVAKADAAVAAGGNAAEQVQQSSMYRWLVTAGLVAYGMVHLLLAALVVQVIGGADVDASQVGSFELLAGAPLGFLVLILAAVGLGTLVIWQILLGLYGYRSYTGFEQLARKVSSVGRAVVYGWLAFACGRVLVLGRQDSNGTARETSRALLDDWYGGPVLVGIGAIVIGIGVATSIRGVTRSFLKDDLIGTVPRWAAVLGSIGWFMKGITQALVGGLLWIAVWRHDPGSAGSLDLALRSLAVRPPGTVALIVIAAGFAAFGLYCFPWAFNARHDVSQR